MCIAFMYNYVYYIHVQLLYSCSTIYVCHRLAYSYSKVRVKYICVSKSWSIMYVCSYIAYIYSIYCTNPISIMTN